MKQKIVQILLINFLITGLAIADQENQPEKSVQQIEPIAFDVGKCAFMSPYFIYLASDQSGMKELSLSHYTKGVLTPLASEKVTLNHCENQINPFYNKAISYLMMHNNNPIVVTQNSSKLHFVDQFQTKEKSMAILSTDDIHDAKESKDLNSSLKTSEIVGISWGMTGTSPDRIGHYIFTAVKPHDGQWGEYGSGISVVKFDIEVVKKEKSEKEKEEQKKKDESAKEENKEDEYERRFFLNILNARTGASRENKPYPIDAYTLDHNPIDISGGLEEIIGSEVNLYWDEIFSRLYIPLQIKTKNNAQNHQGACALLVGTIYEDKLYIYPIVNSDAFSEQYNNIIGAVGPNKSVSLFKVNTLHTSTGLPYLIIHGGNGEPEQAKKKIFALPLINKSTKNLSKKLLLDKDHGAIAQKQCVPDIRFYREKYSRFRGRLLYDSVQAPEDFYSDLDQSVQVGAGIELPDIVEIFSLWDCVVALRGDGKRITSIVYSQALFDGEGKIVSWTSWLPMPTGSRNILGIEYDQDNSALVFLEKTENNFINLTKSSWVCEQDQIEDNQLRILQSKITTEFPKETGGVQNLFEFIPSFCKESAILVATGNKKVILTTIGTHQSIFTLQNPVLDQLGPILAADMIEDDCGIRLLVGGVNGVAISSNLYPLLESQAENSVDSTRIVFDKIGDCRYVQKIIHDNEHLYILTRNSLERCIHSQLGTLSKSVLLADAKQLQVKFTDVLVSKSLGLLGTTRGLIRIGNGKDIRSIKNHQEANWVPVHLPIDNLFITKLYPLCCSNNQADVGLNGQVYVLSNVASQNNSQVFRLFIKDVSIYGVNNETVQLVGDYCFKDQETSFINFGGYRNNFATDGLLHVSCRNDRFPLLHVIPGFVGGKLIPSSRGYTVRLKWSGNNWIQPILKSSLTGNWLIAGDFGLCIYQ
ncbi:MAG: hypothetical protein WDZ41_02880 [Candidatus Babeliales bacterium]